MDTTGVVNKLLGGFDKATLDAAFDKVRNKDHWKGPIDVTLPLSPDDIVAIAYAVPFFTATGANFTLVSPGVYRVTAPGYWAGPAN